MPTSTPFSCGFKVIKNETMTPDFNSPGSVLYQWQRA